MGMPPPLPAVQRASGEGERARAGGQASKGGIMVFFVAVASSIWCQRPPPPPTVMHDQLPKPESAHSQHSAD